MKGKKKEKRKKGRNLISQLPLARELAAWPYITRWDAYPNDLRLSAHIQSAVIPLSRAHITARRISKESANGSFPPIALNIKRSSKNRGNRKSHSPPPKDELSIFSPSFVLERFIFSANETNNFLLGML